MFPAGSREFYTAQGLPDDASYWPGGANSDFAAETARQQGAMAEARGRAEALGLQPGQFGISPGGELQTWPDQRYVDQANRARELGGTRGVTSQFYTGPLSLTPEAFRTGIQQVPGGSWTYGGGTIENDYQPGSVQPGYSEDGYTFTGGDAADEGSWVPDDEFAMGGRSGGGPALVGELGPEVLDLPRGTQVTPVAHGPWERWRRPMMGALVGRR